MFTVRIYEKIIDKIAAGKFLERMIYEQTVDEIDIVRVISAVNGGLYEVTPKLNETLIDPRGIIAKRQAKSEGR